MMIYREIDGIQGTMGVTLVHVNDTTNRVRIEHTVTPDLAGQTLPKGKYLPRRIGALTFPTRIIESVDIPRDGTAPCQVAQELVHKHVGNQYTVDWQGRGWWIELA